MNEERGSETAEMKDYEDGEFIFFRNEKNSQERAVFKKSHVALWLRFWR